MYQLAKCCMNCDERGDKYDSKIWCSISRIKMPLYGYCECWRLTTNKRILTRQLRELPKVEIMPHRDIMEYFH